MTGYADRPQHFKQLGDCLALPSSYLWPTALVLLGEELMIKKKPYDGVVVAVRYSSQGEIERVRVFERHGFVFTDRMMMNRTDLVERLQNGKRFKTGARLLYQGNDFEIKEDINLVKKNGSDVIIVGQTTSEHDTLGNLPIF